MKIYVGNLPFDVTSDDLRNEFTPFGKVDSAEVIMDRATGRSKGFAFVEMPTVNEAQAAINALNGKMMKERAMTVSPARPRTEDRGGSYGGRGGGGYDRGGRGGGRRY
jgi:RNA recognition motif-containing protein